MLYDFLSLWFSFGFAFGSGGPVLDGSTELLHPGIPVCPGACLPEVPLAAGRHYAERIDFACVIVRCHHGEAFQFDFLCCCVGWVGLKQLF